MIQYSIMIVISYQLIRDLGEYSEFGVLQASSFNAYISF